MLQDETIDGAQVDGPEAQEVDRSPKKGNENGEPTSDGPGSRPETNGPGSRQELPDDDRETWSEGDIKIPEAQPVRWDDDPRDPRRRHRPIQHPHGRDQAHSHDQYRLHVKRMREEELRRKRMNPPLAFPLAMSIVLALLGGLFIHGVVSTADPDDGAIVEGMRIEEVFFVLTEVRNESISVDITIYMTNTGTGDTGVVDITAFAIKTKNNIVYDEGSASIQKIGPDRTAKTIISMEFQKNESYRIDILTFDDRLIGPQGHGQITTGEVEQNVVDFVEDGSSGNKSYAEGGLDDAEMLGGASIIICGLFFVPALFITGYIGASKRGWC